MTKKNGAIVFLTFDPKFRNKFWLDDYFPFIKEYDRRLPPLDDVVALIQATTRRTVEVSTLMLPPDLSDMFLAAGWRRPEIYLNPEVRTGMSAFALANSQLVEKGVKLLQKDLISGEQGAKYGKIQQLKQIDIGYRFLFASVAN